jgi:NADH-quinone oxidoreductase subunit J
MELLAQDGLMPGMTGDTAEIAMFWVFAVLALGTGIAVITMRNIVHGALMLVVNLLAIAGLYLTLESPFLGIIQVLVYGGAIMVLFLFVIMLLGVDRDDLLLATHVPTRILAVVGAALLAGALLLGFVGPYTGDASVCGPDAGEGDGVSCVGLAEAVDEHEGGSVGLLGERLFTRYTYPFELAALLLTVATIGATVLGRRRDPEPDDPLPAHAGPVAGADGIDPDGGVPWSEEEPAQTGAVEGSQEPAEHGLPQRPDRDREV